MADYLNVIIEKTHWDLQINVSQEVLGDAISESQFVLQG